MKSIAYMLEEILSDASEEEMTRDQARKCLFDCGIIDENITIGREFRKYLTPKDKGKDKGNDGWQV